MNLQLVKSKIHLLLHRLQLGLDLLQLILYIEYGHVWDKSDFICCIGDSGLGRERQYWVVPSVGLKFVYIC